MPVSDQAFPRLDTQLIDPRTFRVSQPWYRFFIALWVRSGSGSGFDIETIVDESSTAFLSDLMGDRVSPVDQDPAFFSVVSDAETQEAAASLNFLPWTVDQGETPVARVRSVGVGTSPATYTARVPGNLLITGGTITDVSLIRAGVTTTLPAALALVPLSPGDVASVTYTAAPTFTFIPG